MTIKSDMTTGQNKSLQEHAMRFGTAMGLFWIFKFILLPLGFKAPFLQLLFIILTCFVPILGYRYARTFRDKYCGGEIMFSRVYIFLIFMYFFAALLAAVGHFVYFNFIDDGFIINTYISQLESLKVDATDEMVASIDGLTETFSLVAEMSPIHITMQLIFQNIFYGSLLALPTALFVMKRKKQVPDA